MKLRGLIINLLAFLAIALPCMAAVVTSATVPPTRASLDTITATVWNNDVLGIYTYLNNNIVAVLNVLTAKGDQYVYNGAALTKQSVGSDGQVLTADSVQATGIKWAALANTTQLTTKGDLLGYAGAAARIPVGADGQTLTADSTQALGVKWANPPTNIPKGTIVAWSPAGAGTSTIPSGWGLCDGTIQSGVQTPNLIGKFIVGTRPAGSVAAPATGGYGAQAVDAAGAGSITHTHSFSATGTTGGPSATNTRLQGSGTSVSVPTSAHTHTVTVSGSSSAGSFEPSDYALVYICKL